MTETPSLESRALALFEAALDQPSDAREAFVRAEAGGDEALAARVLKLLSFDESAASLIRTGGAGEDAADHPPPERIGAYRIVDLIGQGGMGAVYRAERDAGDFEHEAAIKIIRPGVLSDALEARFQAERQTLARLNHPHIARLFDGGETEDGAPFFIMELVDGEPILDDATARGLSLDARLGLFRDACSAVRHAHQNLIVHRDITPTNVLVTKDGVVKLIDFGIARPPQPDVPEGSPDTESAESRTYTPGYAAPERISSGIVNTLSDIYSLGRLLKDLTAGLAPSADLAAIIARASARDPAARYGSVDSLVEDIDNLLAGLPVNAREGGLAYRFGKFVARRRYSVAAASLALAGLVGGLVVINGLYRSAETARAEAETRFDEVRELAGFLMFDLYDAAGELPRSTQVRAGIAERAQAYLDGLGAVPNADPSLRLEIAEGWRRLGDVQGNPAFAHLGDTEAARESFARAEATLDALPALGVDPASETLQRAQLALSRAGVAMYGQVDTDLAAAQAREAITAFEALAPEPMPAQGHLGALRARVVLADVLVKSGEPDAALDVLDEAEATLEKARPLAGDLPDRDRRWLDLNEGAIEYYRGNAHYLAGSMGADQAYAAVETDHGEKAIAAYERAAAAYDAARETWPDWRRLTRNWTIAPYEAAGVLAEMGEEARAAASFDLALERARVLAAGDPNDEEARLVLDSVEAARAFYLAMVVEDPAGLSALRAIYETRAARADERPDDARARYHAISLLRPLGDSYWNQDQVETACETYDDARAAFDAFDTAFGLPEELRQSEYALILQSIDDCEE